VFVVSLNMNTDYGFTFHLFGVLKCLRHYKIESRFGEEASEVQEKLPQINYALLKSLPISRPCYREHPFRRKGFAFEIVPSAACPDYNS
jgi:hypothetical protein